MSNIMVKARQTLLASQAFLPQLSMINDKVIIGRNIT